MATIVARGRKGGRRVRSHGVYLYYLEGNQRKMAAEKLR
jgi:hypothetical protein